MPNEITKLSKLFVQITQRVHTKLEWDERYSTSVLAYGELGLEYAGNNSFRIKIGDGVHQWKDLPYWGPTPSLVAEEKNNKLKFSFFLPDQE
jgi:hypothetical protein